MRDKFISIIDSNISKFIIVDDSIIYTNNNNAFYSCANSTYRQPVAFTLQNGHLLFQQFDFSLDNIKLF